jgi:hypothetical protein
MTDSETVRKLRAKAASLRELGNDAEAKLFADKADELAAKLSADEAHLLNETAMNGKNFKAWQYWVHDTFDDNVKWSDVKGRTYNPDLDDIIAPEYRHDWE